MTIGWQFFAEGVHLREAPATGVLALDLIANRAELKGEPIQSAMLEYGRDWLSAELMRLHRNGDWVHKASIDIRYMLRRTTDRDLWAAVDLEARAHVASASLEAEARFTNSQVLSNRESQPISSLWSAVKVEILHARGRVEWTTLPLEPRQHDERLAAVDLLEAMFAFLQRAESTEPTPQLRPIGRSPTTADLQRALAMVDAALTDFEAATEAASHAGDRHAMDGNLRAAAVAEPEGGHRRHPLPD